MMAMASSSMEVTTTVAMDTLIGQPWLLWPGLLWSGLLGPGGCGAKPVAAVPVLVLRSTAIACALPCYVLKHHSQWLAPDVLFAHLFSRFECVCAAARWALRCAHRLSIFREKKWLYPHQFLKGTPCTWKHNPPLFQRNRVHLDLHLNR
jgi:hypothetical protein